MGAVRKNKSKGLITAVLGNKCPRCRCGNMYLSITAFKRGFMKMHENCEACGQAMEIETGFYYGTGYVSYALAVALSVASFIAWWVLIGISINDNRVFWWLGFNTLILVGLQPWLMRLSRRIWLGFFVHYNPTLQGTKSIMEDVIPAFKG